ncbi:Murein DD-endopeptidase MepM [Pseudidiomarina piscicola]|uniref:Murein DD-endopeptidase MepM n=1 Tax=Pseudidiomarina piscicola TaxID=2614830 RepID=A0A6S6WM07_9GAMM|nr:M23 family metallopeptidase [Pseudidiomarina piscicola]CAB0150778.1 Murein DD-endopeptidase MepM [Pseudidiomarina piscicola]VZT40281.1 Murein DD-endopeptidase MepM [Pseudomonas aeruginosa]
MKVFQLQISALACALLLTACSEPSSETTEAAAAAEPAAQTPLQLQPMELKGEHQQRRQQTVVEPVRQTAKQTQQAQLDVTLMDQAAPLKGVDYAVLKRGQTVTGLLSKYGFKARDVYALAEALDGVINLDKLQSGTAIAVKKQAHFAQVSFADEYAERVDAIYEKGRWSVHKVKVPTRIEVSEHAVQINHSLYGNAAEADVPGDVINSALLALSHFIDFQRQVYQGNRFEVVFERTLVTQDEALFEHQQTPLQVTYLRFQNDEDDFRLYRYEDSFYLEDGRLAESFLLKTPLNGARLSSHYGQRKHPVLGYTRMHKGIDFGAPEGTPIMAAGSGTIKQAEWYGSYGNAVIITHADGYETLYAHLKGYAEDLTAGDKVKQGQVIGYLGNTGLSQARHLHYEVYRHGKTVNPLNLKKLSTERLAGPALAQFVEHVTSLEDRTLRLANFAHGASATYAAGIDAEAR